MVELFSKSESRGIKIARINLICLAKSINLLNISSMPLTLGDVIKSKVYET